ncbi:MAG: hypothetical protein M0Q21_10470 [Ignavibacteriaceae bacterium]|nr:hypothetical protein [Ignavibacteriaceae bacterium]
MKKHFLSFVFICIALFNLSCKKSPTEVVDNTQPGRRDYVWTVDTISTDPFVYITRFWGSAPNDIWAVGGNLFHYDGNKWVEIKTKNPVYPQAVFGFSQNDVWAAGYSKIWHYNGNQWSFFSDHSLPGYHNSFFNRIWGETANDVYLVGGSNSDSLGNYKGIVLHYDGIKWNYIDIPELRVAFADVKKSSSKLIFTAYQDENNSSTTFFVLEYGGNTFKILYKGNEVPQLTYLKGNLFVNIGKKVFKYYDGTLVQFFDFVQLEYVGGFWGRTEKDFFCVTQNGLGHYNGTDLATIYNFDINKQSPFNGLLFENEVFFLGRDEQANISIIIKGKLTK